MKSGISDFGQEYSQSGTALGLDVGIPSALSGPSVRMEYLSLRGLERPVTAFVPLRTRNGLVHMQTPDFRTSYLKHTQDLSNTMEAGEAMSAAVGGDFETVGKVERDLLLQEGLQKSHTVIDVGCGSGRLAVQLRDCLEGKYIGMDVVPDLIAYAKSKCARPDWAFYDAPGLSIPEPDGCADFVCFFSVFTHLLYEQSFTYLADAKRVIRPSGKIVFSFLEFRIPSHWWIFQQSLADTRPDKVLNQFLSRDAIEAWARHLDLRILGIYDGDKPHIQLREPVKWANGTEMAGVGSLGQSVCVMTK